MELLNPKHYKHALVELVKEDFRTGDVILETEFMPSPNGKVVLRIYYNESTTRPDLFSVYANIPYLNKNWTQIYEGTKHKDFFELIKEGVVKTKENYSNQIKYELKRLKLI